MYLSLFNGISAGRLALSRVGINFSKYYIAEIDKFANKVSEFHYPDNIQLGDVNNWREWDIDWSQVRLVTAGFPCQSWSLAGKQLGDKDPRGHLFWVTLDIIKHVLKSNPHAKYVLENVHMKQEFERYITKHTECALGRVHKTLLDSAYFSAQNRKRYFWTNFHIDKPERNPVQLEDILGEKDVTGGAIRGRFDSKLGRIVQRLEVRPGGLSNALTTVQKDNVLVYTNTSTYRNYTPRECALLQTFPAGWCEDVVSKTQALKAYGNAWTVDVMAHIFKHLKDIK